MYVRMPYIFEGILYGLCAGIMTLVLLTGATYGAKSFTEGAFPQGNLFQVYVDYLPWLILGTLLMGVFLGVVSSFLAIRRYLRV